MTTWLNPNSLLSGWTSVPSENLQAVLNSLYWESLTRELCSTILSLQRLVDVPPIPEEEDVAQRLAGEAAYFASVWSPFKLNDESETDALWECAATDMAGGSSLLSTRHMSTAKASRPQERQQQQLQHRRARMLLAGLGLLDVRELIEFRNAPLKCLEGKAQVNIVQVPAGEPSILVHTLGCCDCRRPIRTHFYNCHEGCIHHDKGSQSFCAFAKHQYNVCLSCYRESQHPKQHLKKIRPYDPLADNIVEGMDGSTIKRLARDVKRLQDHENKREAQRDGQEALRILYHATPEMARKRLLPFGNVHSSVMFGPLVFEIGVPHSQGGALISHRQTPDLAYSETWKFTDAEMTTPAVAVSPDKHAFTSVRKTVLRSVHATLMRVMGGLFSGHNPNWRRMEHKIVENLVFESGRYRERPGKSREFNERSLREAAFRIVNVIKEAVGDEVATYLRHFSSRLSDPKTDLKVDTLKVTNNCQTFCRNLLVGPDPLFKSVLSRARPLDDTDNIAPRYMLSFTTDRIGSLYDSEAFQTTPSAAYLREFHTGEDILEYFDTWPHIPRTNACAQLLCWPCLSESGCSIARHMWQMPHETTSVIAFHTMRNRADYHYAYRTADPKEDEPRQLTDAEWFQNRLRVLLALDTFLVSAGAIIASYQMLDDVADGGGARRLWKPASAAERGTLILPGSDEEGTQNFSIRNAEKSILPVWFSKNRKLEKHIAKTAR